MPKPFLRLIVFLLVPCLIVESAAATAFSPRSAQTALLTPPGDRFGQEALASVALEGHQSEMGNHIPFWKRPFLIQHPRLWHKHLVWSVLRPFLRYAGTANFHR